MQLSFVYLSQNFNISFSLNFVASRIVSALFIFVIISEVVNGQNFSQNHSIGETLILCQSNSISLDFVLRNVKSVLIKLNRVNSYLICITLSNKCITFATENEKDSK